MLDYVDIFFIERHILIVIRGHVFSCSHSYRKTERRKKVIYNLSIVLTALSLAFTKYSGFIGGSFTSIYVPTGMLIDILSSMEVEE